MEVEPFSFEEQHTASSVSSKDTQAATHAIHVWYRHSGEKEIDGWSLETKFRSVNSLQEILPDVGRNHVTHLHIRSGDLPLLDDVAQHLTDLKVEGLTSASSWQRLANLTQLERLDLSNNLFGDGLPLAVTRLTSLRHLLLQDCELKDLPTGFSNLQNVEMLNLCGNSFHQLPSSVYKLNKLQTLDVSSNRQLTSIEKEILQLTNLIELNCADCDSMTHPPKPVCQQGLQAVKQYFTDLVPSKGIKLGLVPIVVVGSSHSGITSLIRSLQLGERELTHRDETSPMEGIIKAFQANVLHFEKFSAKVIDYGGQETCYVVHSIAKENLCFPIAVVNVQQFKQLADAVGPKNATQWLLLDWLAHLYIASPHLGSPILVLTHTDMLAPEEHEHCKMELLVNAEVLRMNFLEEERQLSMSSPQVFQNIDHFKRTHLPLIQAKDVFEFDGYRGKTDNILQLRSNLEQRCSATAVVIPEHWSEVKKFLESVPEFCLTVSEIAGRIQMEDLVVVLRYLHNSGDILWFEEHPKLSEYVFPNVAAVVDLISLLFRHEQWKLEVEKFTPFLHKGDWIDIERYTDLVAKFAINGILDEALLFHLLNKNGFPADIALNLLQLIGLVHGPVSDQLSRYYIVPYFAQSVMPAGCESNGRLRLRLDLLFKGLSPKNNVFHQITVAVLNYAGGPLTTISVKRNGVAILDGECAVHLLHDYMSRKVTLQVSTPVNKLGMSWKKLLEITAHIASMLQETWPVSRVETLAYCAHCLFVGDSNPSIVAHPGWLYTGGTIDINQVKTFPGVHLVTCKRSHQIAPAVPSPLMYPCYDLTVEEIEVLHKYLTSLDSNLPGQESGGDGQHLDAFPPQKETTTLPMSATSAATFEEDSDLSDDMEFLDERNETNDIIGQHISFAPVTKPTIKALFQSDLVYKMSTPTRGRCLIINNEYFGAGLPPRTGSEMDVQNFSDVFTNLSFHTLVYRNLTSQDLLKVIEEETAHPDHAHYGMFVLIIMSHGNETQLCGADGRHINLSDIYNRISPRMFPAMIGKPRWIIIQDCSGVVRDQISFDDEAVPSIAMPSSVQQPIPVAVQQPPHEIGHLSEVPSSNILLDSDNLFIMRSSWLGFVSSRHRRSGSWFTRALVEALYKHSHHRDVTALFEEQVMKKVRRKSISYHRQAGGHFGGQQPVMISCSTGGRKLYLFPGYNP